MDLNTINLSFKLINIKINIILCILKVKFVLKQRQKVTALTKRFVYENFISIFIDTHIYIDRLHQY